MNDLAKILGIYDAKVKLKSINDHTISFYIYTDTKPHLCPHCNLYTSKVHDYRMQKIKDIPLHNKSCILFLNKRRYHCSGCGKHFYESYDFVSRYLHRTQRLTKFIAHSFYDSINIKHASIRANVSTHTVYKVLGTLNNSSDRIGEAISIDEFKGNVGTEKYQTIVVDPIKHKVLDILYSRKSTCLVEYFKSLDKSKRMNVKYFSCDMNKTFIDMAKTYFPNAKIVIDRYHFIRQVYWALENVRKNVQKNMSKTLRRYYKRSRHIITTRESILSEENKAALRLMLEYSEDLRKAHFIKELFIKLLDEKSYSKQRVLLHEWLLEVESSGIKEFNAAITAFRNNYKYILNSLKYRHISNGPTEGFNNKIKVLKRISYGVRNFKYFRNRILMATA